MEHIPFAGLEWGDGPWEEGARQLWERIGRSNSFDNLLGQHETKIKTKLYFLASCF